MQKTILTHNQEWQIHTYYRETSDREFAKMFGVSKFFIQHYREKKGLYKTKEDSQKVRTRARNRRALESQDTSHDRYIIDNYLTIPIKTIASDIGRSDTFVRTRMKRLGISVPKEISEKRKAENYFQKGQKAHNKGKKIKDPVVLEKIKKTQFKKGHLPVCTKYDGAISIRKDKQGLTYKYVRVKKREWELLHRVNWIKKNGPIPKGKVLRCKDGETLNCDPANWELISMKENMNKNSGSKNLSDGYVVGRLTPKKPELRKVIREEYPELIDLARHKMLLNRKIRNHEQK